MTRKRDLKKRIRDRQAKTGETYTTARRHVLAAREPGDDIDDIEATNPGIAVPEPDGDAIEVIDRTSPAEKPRGIHELAETARTRFVAELERARRNAPETAEHRKLVESNRRFEVDELIDISHIAKELGLGCKVLLYPRLAKVAEPSLVLEAIRTALGAMKNDPTTQLLRAVVAGQAQTLRIAVRAPVLRDPEFMERIGAGLTAVSKDGRMLALHVNGYAGMVTIVCAVWRKTNTLMITTPDDRLGPVLAGFPGLGESLFLVYEGRRYKIGHDPFVIGRHPSCDLRIKDGYVSRKHVAIVQRHGTYYILDLGSHAGIEYKGMKISNKRIDEGDMFMVHEYALRFTFHETDA